MRRLAAVAVLALVVPAAAHAGLQIRGVDLSGYPHVHLTVVTGSPSEVPSLREKGKPPVGLHVTNLGRSKSVALLIDRSRSMAGRALEDAVAAARAFVAAKAGSDRVAVFAFGSHAVQLTGFSSTRDDVDPALRSIAVDRKWGTALYDALALAAKALSREQSGGRVVLVVTDGTDVSSHTDLAGALGAAHAAAAPVYAVGIEGRQFSARALRAISRPTGGIYRVATSTGALSQIYSAIAAEFRRTWLLDYVTAVRPGDRLRLSVAAGGVTKSVAPLVPGPTSAAGGSSLPSVVFTPAGTAVLALIVGLFVLIAVGLVGAGRRVDRLRGRLAPHLGKDAGKQKRPRGRERLAALAGLFRATERAFAHTGIWRAVERRLERSDIPLRTVELVYVSIGSALGLSLLVALAGPPSTMIVVAMLVGLAAPFVVVSYKARRRQAAFEAQLPDLLLSLAASLKAGHSLKQGLQAVVDEGLEPSAKELKRVLMEMRLGRPLEQSLVEMAERIGSKDFAFIVTAVNIQNQVGGSLASLFDLVADTVRQRQQFSRKIRSLTAMGRMSAYVLIGLPIFLLLALTALNSHYMAPLYHTSTGHTLVIVAALMMIVGSLVLRKIVAFKG